MIAENPSWKNEIDLSIQFQGNVIVNSTVNKDNVIDQNSTITRSVGEYFHIKLFVNDLLW